MLGLLFILTGALVPASALVEFLREIPEDLMDQLLLGATLFKIGLIILGLVIIILARLPVWKSEAQSEEPKADLPSKASLAVLAIILVAALALRLYGLSSGLWHDEILTYVNYVRMPFGEIISTYPDQNQHFLYTLLAHAAFGAFGESAWSLRLPAVLFGVGSIGAMYLLGRQVASTQEALLSAGLLTFSYHHIWFSQNARGYIGLLFWTILATWLLVRALNEARPQLWLFYAMAAALGFYTNMTMLFVVAGHSLVYLIALFARRKEEWPRRWSGLFLGFCMAGFLIFLLTSLALPQVVGGLVGEGSEESTVRAWTNPLWALFEFVKAIQVGFAGGLVAAIALVVFGVGFLSYARTSPVVIQLLIIPTILCAAVVVGLGHHLWPRFFIFTMGFGALVVIRGIMLLGQAITKVAKISFAQPPLVGTVLAIGMICVSALSIPPVYGPKQDFLRALQFIESTKQPGDVIVTVGLASFTYQKFYEKDWKQVQTLEELNAIRAGAHRTWLIYTFPPEVESVYPEVMAAVYRDFAVKQQFYGTVGSGTIYVCLADAPLSLSSTPANVPSSL
jgi:hypothetical protein